MTTVIRGTTAALAAEFHEYPPDGPLVDVNNLTIQIVPLLGGTPALAETSIGITHPATGIYGYPWAVPFSLTPGEYVVIWSGDDQGTGDPVEATEQISVSAAQGGGGGEVGGNGPCGWTIDTSCVPGWDDLPAHAQLMGFNMATLQLWALTGRRFGQCEVTVQPCQERKRLPLYLTFPVPGAGFYGGYGGTGGWGPVIEDGQWFNRCWGGCRCRARCETPLDGPTSTAGILEVTVRGEVISPAAYQIQDNHLLVRTDGQCWPTCADYSDQDPPEFTVNYLRGEELDPALQIAGGILAYEYGLSCISSEDCRLPTRLQSLSRQGVSVQAATGSDFIDFGMTQIAEVDQIVIALNPNRLPERPRVLSPDRPRPRMVT